MPEPSAVLWDGSGRGQCPCSQQEIQSQTGNGEGNPAWDKGGAGGGDGRDSLGLGLKVGCAWRQIQQCSRGGRRFLKGLCSQDFNQMWGVRKRSSYQYVYFIWELKMYTKSSLLI